jgi:hypothetical protein
MHAMMGVGRVIMGRVAMMRVWVGRRLGARGSFVV